MPSGSYLHLDPYDGTPAAIEEFSCAAGPVGWRYVGVLRAPVEIAPGTAAGPVPGEPAGSPHPPTGPAPDVPPTAPAPGAPSGGRTAGAGPASGAPAAAPAPGASAAPPAVAPDVPPAVAALEASSAAPAAVPPGTPAAAAASGGVIVGAGPELGRVDVTLDAGGRQLRVELAAGGWRLRGGVAGTETVWLRSAGADDAVERSAAALGFAGRSPAFLVATARRLALSAGGRARVRLVAVTEPALGTRLISERWSLLGITSHATETGPLPVARYEIADLDTGEVRTLHLAGDVVIAAPALELVSLTAPPSL